MLAKFSVMYLFWPDLRLWCLTTRQMHELSILVSWDRRKFVSWQCWSILWFGILRRPSQVWANVFHSCHLRPTETCQLAMVGFTLASFMTWVPLGTRQTYELILFILVSWDLLTFGSRQCWPNLRFGILRRMSEVWANISILVSWDHLKFVSWPCWPKLRFGILRSTLEA